MLPKLVAEYDSESRTPIRRAARSAAHRGCGPWGPGPGRGSNPPLYPRTRDRLVRFHGW